MRCSSGAVPGATVCRMHGGAASQVLAAARLRLLSMVDPSLATLGRAISKRNKGIPGPQEIAAARDILDRAGLGATQAHRMVDEEGNTAHVMTWEQLEQLHAGRQQAGVTKTLPAGRVIDVENTGPEEPEAA